MKRLLRLLAAMALVPVVVFANPQTAAAASTGVTLFAIDGAANNDGDCRVSWARTSTGVSIAATSRCDSMPDISPGYCQPFEADCGSYGLVIKSADGGTCGSAAFTPYASDYNSAGHVSQNLGAGFIALPVATCVPAMMCLSYYFQASKAAILAGIPTVDSADCSSWTDPKPPGPGPFEPPVEVGPGCEFGTPGGVYTQHAVTWDTLVKDRLRLLFWRRPVEPSWTYTQQQWQLKVAHGTASSIGAVHPTNTMDNGNGENPQWVSALHWENNPTGLGGSHSGPEPQILGVQVISLDPTLSQTTGGWPIGYTNPEKCSFWFGPKIRDGDHPTYGSDDPYGPMRDLNEPTPTPTPEPTPEPVPIPTGDVDTNGNVLSGLLGLLNKIWDWLSGLFDKIRDLLKSLFIPDTDNWGIRDFRNTLEEKPPFSIGYEFATQARQMGYAFKDSSGCASIWHTASIVVTCDTPPAVKTLYALVQFALVSLTGLYLFRFVSGVLQDGS